MRRDRSALRGVVAFVVAMAMVAGLVPAPALAEAVGEIDEERSQELIEPVSEDEVDETASVMEVGAQSPEEPSVSDLEVSEVNATIENISKMGFEHEGVDGGCNWYIDESGMLVIEPAEGGDGVLSSLRPWMDFADQILSVDVLDGVSAPTDSSGLFMNLTQVTTMNLSHLNTSLVTNMSHMFDGCTELTRLDVSGWNTSQVTDMSYMFNGQHDLYSLDVSGWDTSHVTNMKSMFSAEIDQYGGSRLHALDVSEWDTSQVTDMSGMFFGCTRLTSLDVSRWNTSHVTDMSGMFSADYYHHTSALTSLDVSGWDTSCVTDMRGMFQGCDQLVSLDVSRWDTSSVKDMKYMFRFCSSLTSLNTTDWDTSQVTDMFSMFQACESLASLDVSGWDTSQVKDMYYMFYCCLSLRSLDVSGWDTSSVTNTTSMFGSCCTLASLDLSSWDTSGVTGMSWMFRGCSSLESIELGKAFTIKSEDMFPDATASNGKWWSSVDKVWYTKDDIVAERSGIADTYLSKEPEAINISSAAITVAAQTYTGEALVPDPVVQLGGATLKKGVDYTVSYANNVNAGTATVTVTGKGNYAGTASGTFAIEAKTVVPVVSLSATSYTYDGKVKSPTVTVKDNAVTLKNDVDYTVTTPLGRTNVGTYVYNVTLKGNYSGTGSSRLTIAKAASAISLAAQTQTYTGKALKYSGKVTKTGSAGTVTYAYFSDAKCTKSVKASAVKNAGTYYAKATVAADGNYEAATSAAAKISVAKKANTLKVKAAKATQAASAKKATTIKAAKAFKVTKNAGKGKVTYKKTSGNAKIVVASSGKVTVKKGLKAGKTYTVKVKATSKATKNYKAKSATVTFKVKVK